MRIKLDENKPVQIELGDIFISDEENSYILIYHGGLYLLYNMESGNTHWEADKSLDDLASRIKINVENGILTHYPKGLYHLTLSKGN